MTDGRAAPETPKKGSVVSGAVITALGLLAMAIAAVELYVFSGIVAPGAGPGHVENARFGMTTGTGAYVVGYAAAGIILTVLGVWKIYRARSGR